MSTGSLNKLSAKDRHQVMLGRLQAITEAKGGKIITGDYQNKRSLFTFECTKKHRWTVEAQTILTGSWCRKCWDEDGAGKHLKLTNGLEQAQKIAVTRGGECLSAEYKTNNSPLMWKCANGHEWKAALSDIRKGTWCPTCGSGVRERLCRHWMESITGKSFPKIRPAWLVNTRENRMELDGYCEELKIGFEHHGEQHYQKLDHFQRRDESLEQRKIDDQTKSRLCKEHGISLVEIPFSIHEDALPNWIYENLSKLLPNIKLNEDVTKTPLNFVSSNELSDLKKFAQAKGGDCLSAVYLGATKNHQFKCHLGHEWKAIPANIKSGTWCPTCKPALIGSSNRKHSVETMQNLAASKGGQFISPTFTSVNNRYLWRCSKGHEWLAAPTDIQKGTWCRNCSTLKQRDSIADMQDLAKSRGGECLSKDYINQQLKLKWRCGSGHEWDAKPSNVKNKNSWCPICAKRRKKITN